MKYELPSTELIVIEENNYLKFGEYLNDMQCDDTANKLSLDDLEYVKKLQQENKILRENAEHNDKVVDKVNWENMLLKKENQDLKKQLEEYKRLGFKHLNDKCNKLENQQKDFIEYLENEINKIKEQIKNYDIWHEVGTDINFLILKKQFNIEILSKFKKIIGSDINVGSIGGK